MKPKNKAFAAMKFAGVTRDMMRKLTKKDRIMLWMGVVMMCEMTEMD